MKSKIFLEMCKIRKPKSRYSKFPGVLIGFNGLNVTNLETAVTYRMRPVATPFSFDLDDGKAETLAKTAKEIEFANLLPGDPNGKVRISGDEISIEIPEGPVNEFPRIPVPEETKAFEVFEMPWAEFCEKGIRTAEFACREARGFALHGVYFNFPGEGKPGSFVATDGRRLAILKGPETDREFKCIIPRAFFKAFYSITKIEKPETVRILANEKEIEVSGPGMDGPAIRTQIANVWIEAGNFLFNQLMIDGQFPDYRRVFPSSEPVMTTTIGPAQKNTIDKACKFAEEGRGLEIYRNKLVIKDVEFPQVFTFEGTMEFGPMFNPNFLADFTDDEFDVEIYGHDKPMMLHAEDACYLVMPIVKDKGSRKYKLFETGEELPEPEPEKVEFNGVMEATPVENPAA